jgi:hypothetical protein
MYSLSSSQQQRYSVLILVKDDWEDKVLASALEYHDSEEDALDRFSMIQATPWGLNHHEEED